MRDWAALQAGERGGIPHNAWFIWIEEHLQTILKFFSLDAKESILKKFLAQFYESPLKLPLLGSAAVSVLVGNMDNAICITAAILIVVVAKILVLGDLVAFSVGDQIPANIRLMRANNLEIDKSPMTGETKPIKKQTKKGEIQNRLPDISERTNVALMGTLVRSGNGSGIVVRTGGRRLKGSTAALDGGTGQEAEHNLVCGHWGDLPDWSIAEEELARDVYGWQSLVSLAFAAIPKGLPILVTVTLALGVWRMSKQNAISKLSIMICMPTLL
ncbi:E1-E2 ATPase-domain-containing protein [Phakopsora pachyrhizi]|nr:E1-E2 ATPase-domain-containing protein [Phakopsora pachyrhizi]